MSRGILVAAGVLMCALLPACAADPGRDTVPEASEPFRTHGWSRVPHRGTVRDLEPSYDGVIAAGVDDGEPMLVTITGGGTSYSLGARLTDRYDDQGLRSVVLGSEAFAVTGAGAASPKNAKYWAGDPYSDGYTAVPRTPDERSPVWVEPLLDDEGGFRMLGVVPRGDRWELHGWEDMGEWVHLGGGPRLYVREEPTSRSLHGAGMEVWAAVAGEVTANPDVDGPPEVWIAESAYDHGDEAPWRRLPLSPAPGAVTDLDHWALGFWVAGHRDGVPVVYDFDQGSGATVDVPRVALDPEHPQVSLAGDFRGVDALGLQTTQGPSVFLRMDGTWQEMRAPAGRLDAAVVTRGRAYLLIDGQVWHHPVPASFRRAE